MDKLLHQRFNRLNEELKNKNQNIKVILIGGQLGRYLLPNFRGTYDIDVIVRDYMGSSPIVRECLESSNIENVTVVDLPPEEDIEFKETIKYSNLEVCIPDFEYFALTKIFSDRLKDEVDLIESDILKYCDKEKLLNLVDEYKNDVLNPNNPNLNLLNLEEYFQKHGL